jgi:two-component system chemotaxis sensor kinase CheA
MDVVKTNIERIGGTIEIDSIPGRGTRVRIRIPLTLAIIPALIVTAGGDRYAIPQVNLVELVRTQGGEGDSAVARVYDAQVYRYRDTLLPLLFLHDILRIAGPVQAGVTAAGETALHIVVLHADGVSFGLVVDEINASQEIVVKPLAEALKNTPVFSGATILGDGRVALILDVPGLARHAGVAASAANAETSAASLRPSSPSVPVETLMLFRLRGDRRVAIPLAGVARLEEIPRGEVERSGGREAVQYRGGIMPLVPLADLLEPGSSRRATEATTLRVVVHERAGRSVGLIVDEVLELVEESLALTEVVGRPGVAGSAVIRGRMTDVLDIPGLLAGAEPAAAGSATAASGPAGA